MPHWNAKRPSSAMAKASNSYEPITYTRPRPRPPSAMARLHPPPKEATPDPTPEATPEVTPLPSPRAEVWQEAGYDTAEAIWDDLTDEQLKLMYLISLYSHKAMKPDEREGWMREVHPRPESPAPA